MDDISREPPSEDPGQGIPERGARFKGPAEWSEAVDTSELDGLPAPDFADDVLESRGAFDREELLMALNALPGDEDLPDDVRGATPDGDAAPDGDGDGDAQGPDPAPAAEAQAAVGEEAVEDHPLVGAAADPDPDGDGTEAVPEGDALSRVLCALLLSSREPLTVLRLAQVTNTAGKQVKAALRELEERLQAAGLPLEVAVRGERVSLLTTPDVFEYLRNLRTVKKQEKLSSAALETLAVVAYRQPVIRAEIEAIRGVKAGPILRTLLDHRMIKTVGRADVPGRPLQYGTTQHFLETFGLENLADLPSVKEFRAL